MKKVLCLIIAALMLLGGCSQKNQSDRSYENTPLKKDSPSNEYTFTKNKEGNLVSNSGVEYSFLTLEGILYYFGELEFVGSIQGEEKEAEYWGVPYQTGMFKIKNADNDNILIRRSADSEWDAIYRKTSLPDFDFSVDNCIRLEFLPEDAIHTNHTSGITDQDEIGKFLFEIRNQKDPDEAGLYDLVRQSDGTLENCYTCGAVFGFFAEEPDLVVQMSVTSFNDLAYSISIEEKEYVLPTEWIQKLEIN